MISWKHEGEGGNSRGTRVNADYLVEKLYFVFGGERTLDEKSKSRSDIEDRRRKGKMAKGRRRSVFLRASILSRIFVRTRKLYLHRSVQSERGCGPWDERGRKKSGKKTYERKQCRRGGGGGASANSWETRKSW